MTIVVTGATGTVGRRVVDQLIAANQKVRAVTRNPTTAGLPAGVDVVGADLAEPASLTAAFAGADRLYLFSYPETAVEVAECAQRAGVRRIVTLSSVLAEYESEGALYHLAVERAVESAEVEWTHVRPGMFAVNLLEWAGSIRAEGVVREPYPSAAQTPVHESDVAAVAVAALLEDGHAGKRYPLSGPESLTKIEQAQAIGVGLGREVRFEEITAAQWRAAMGGADMPEEVMDFLLDLWVAASTDPEPVLSTVEDMTGRPAHPDALGRRPRRGVRGCTPMTQRFVRSGDVELWSEGAGNPADPPLLLIASDCLSSTGWPDELVGLLVAGGHHVIRYDHRDTGRSTWRDFAEYPYTFTTLTADAVAVLDGWDIQTVHVYGFGIGGGIGQLLALDHPARLTTLTVSHCFALGVDFFGNWERALNGEPTPDGLPTPQRWFVELAYGMTPLGRPGPGALASSDRRRKLLRRGRGPRMGPSGDRTRRPPRHPSRAPTRRSRRRVTERGPEISRITTPALVIQGMLDPINPPPHGRHLADLLPDARLVEIPGLGHALPRALHRTVADAVLAHTRPRPAPGRIPGGP